MVGVPVMGLFALLAWLSPVHYRAVGSLKLLDTSIDAAAQPPTPQNLNESITRVRDNALVQQTLQTLKQTGTPITQAKPEEFRRALSVTGNPEQQTLALSFNDPNANNAATSLNTHMQSFAQSRQQELQKIRNQVLAQINQRLPQAEENVDKMQQEIQAFQTQFKFIATTNSSRSAAAAYQQAQQELVAVSEQGRALNAQRDELLTKLGLSAPEADILSQVSRSKEFRKIIRDLRQLQAQIKQKRGQFTEQHPDVIDLKRDITTLKNNLRSEISRITGNKTLRLDLLLEREMQQILTSELVELETQRADIIQRAQRLSQSIEQLQKNAIELPKIEQKYQLLERQLNENQQTLDNLLRQKQDITQAIANNTGDIQILKRAEVPRQPIAPFRKPLHLGGGKETEERREGHGQVAAGCEYRPCGDAAERAGGR